MKKWLLISTPTYNIKTHEVVTRGYGIVSKEHFHTDWVALLDPDILDENDDPKHLAQRLANQVRDYPWAYIDWSLIPSIDVEKMIRERLPD